MEGPEKENAAPGKVTALPNRRDKYTTAAAWRRIGKAYRHAGVDTAQHDAHRVKCLQAGWRS